MGVCLCIRARLLTHYRQFLTEINSRIKIYTHISALDTFRHKAFDGNPWAPPRVPKQSGSLLVQSGALLNSIRPVVVTPGRIVIAAGNEKVDYARVHNEGFKGAVAVPAHIRHTRRGDQSVRQHTRRVNIPRRQFIGDARELETELQKRIETYVESVLNN